MNNKPFKRQFPKNLTMNVISFGVNIVIGLWLVPYLIKYIGVAAYGLVPLAMVFTEYISIITISINGAITRFITIDIQKKNWISANQTFNTAFFAMVTLILVQIPLLFYITLDLTNIFEVPNELVTDAYYLFSFTFAGYLLSLMSSIFSTSMYAYNRLDLRKIVDINRVVFRIITIVLCFSIFEPSLKYVGIANFVGAVTSFLYATNYWKKLTPDLIISMKHFRLPILKKLVSMGGWLIVNQIGFLLFLKVDIFVVNKFFGAEATGKYSAVLQWNVLIRTMASVLSNLIGPMLLISFANNRIDDVIKIGKLGVKFLAIGVGIMTGIICGLSNQLLTLWLGPEYAQYSSLMIIMLCHLVINLGVLPLFPINTSLNKVRVPGLVTAGMGIVNLILAILFVTYFDFGFWGVALAGAIAVTAKNGIFTPWYSSKILNISKLEFYIPLLGGIFLFICSFFFASIGNQLVNISNWFIMFVVGTIVFLIVTIMSWFIFMNSSDKEMVTSMIGPKLRAITNKSSSNS
ncbi:oligosaccharide flippase family protein [Echinicola sp. CAU 1574]|uniref:Oligosaccharide flippase family protein n=1 Tax=Echinicola arenosa TaxID=2774144 RepID=A0ABR9ANU5_9BACT|nr:oligosaccharide flippase family protein [Echinicola arenosa]MBD8490482.1 oligosaccharide flippase family protein [Echinicola arenosa]